MRALFGLVLAVALIATSAVVVEAKPFPERIELPVGFRPEGIEVGRGHTFYVGSIPTGAVLKRDLRTGETQPLVQVTGRAAIGIEFDNRNRLFVAGGGTGNAWVYDADTGADITSYDFANTDTFVNDVVVTKTDAWFTDSRKAVLYRVPIAADGTLGAAQTLPLTGDLVLATGNNLNGIDAT